MAKEHSKVAKQIPGTLLRCGPRRLLQYICEKCGSGKPFRTKGGKEITLPAGEYQLTDAELMRVLGTNRRQTIRANRKTMETACRGAVTHDYIYKPGYRYPTIVYHVDLEKLTALTPDGVRPSGSKSVQPSCTESGHLNRTESVHSVQLGCTKTAAHTGVLRTLTVPASLSAPVPPKKQGGVGETSSPLDSTRFDSNRGTTKATDETPQQLWDSLSRELQKDILKASQRMATRLAASQGLDLAASRGRDLTPEESQALMSLDFDVLDGMLIYIECFTPDLVPYQEAFGSDEVLDTVLRVFLSPRWKRAEKTLASLWYRLSARPHDGKTLREQVLALLAGMLRTKTSREGVQPAFEPEEVDEVNMNEDVDGSGKKRFTLEVEDV